MGGRLFAMRMRIWSACGLGPVLGMACAATLALASLASLARDAGAQVRPDLPWRTIGTEHFRIHFTPELEALARRTAFNAEAAWTELARELVPPRGVVDIVVADNVDFANGYASAFPTNRIVIYARPPVEELALRNHRDWNRMLLTHELVHVFHLDRVRGWWRLAQGMFGRAAPFFPNTYAPSWIIEGLAVHYETRLGDDGGRLAGTEFRSHVRAAALEGSLPALDALSLAQPHFPRGNVAYLYGAFAISHDDPRAMRTYVERASERMIPWRQEANARDAFGTSFTRRWEAWRDSVTRAESGVAPLARTESGTVRTLTTHGYTARFPRFVTNTELLYVAEEGRRTTGLYALSLDGERHRLARRTALDANSPLAIGAGARPGTVQGELDYTDPYSIRSDLTRRGPRATPGGADRTRGARLSHPDVHAPTGRIVAVRTTPGSTELVTMDALGAPVRVLARGTLDLNWSDPRWSRDGRRVAAARWADGGRTSIVVLDAAGTELQTFAPNGHPLALVSSPVWVPGDTAILFVSDHEGRAMIYRGDVRSGGYARVWATETALNTPDVSPDGKLMTAVELRGDGYHVVARAMPGALPQTLGDIQPAAPPRAEGERTDTSAAVARYSALRTLLPRWWLPVVASTDPGTARFGFETSGRDVVGRHAYAAAVSLEPRRSELTADVVYEYAGFGVPTVGASLAQDWAHGVVSDTAGAFAGHIGRWDRSISLSATFARPRARRSVALTLGGELESFGYRTYPAELLPRLASGALVGTFDRQAAFASLSLSTLQRPVLAVSSEDGIGVVVTQRQRFSAGVAGEDVAETVVSATLAKSLPGPGYARHVLAARGAYGITSHRATTGFGAGGISGGSLEIVPTVVIGDQRRTFFVRGFEGSSLVGVRAAAASVEYRAPLALVGRGVRMLPLFMQKASVTAFADGGGAWCSYPVTGSFLCQSSRISRATLASVGGELSLDAAVNYDSPYRFRLGVARPVRGERFAARETTVYFTLGSTF